MPTLNIKISTTNPKVLRRAAPLHRRADYLEAVQREKDAYAEGEHLSALRGDAADELSLARAAVVAAWRALSAKDRDAPGL